MPLFKCTCCGKELSKPDEKCSECGMENKKHSLSLISWLLIILSGLIIFAIVLTKVLFTSSFQESASNQASVSPPFKIVVDILSLAGKTKPQIDSILGKSTSSGVEKYPGFKITCFKYRNGQIEVCFIGGYSDWITIHGLENIPCEAKSIQVLGLPMGEPNWTSPDKSMYRWENFLGLKEIDLFKEDIGSGIITPATKGV
jgi:predicted nucleic acid-binding Zn ribbon protein